MVQWEGCGHGAVGGGSHGAVGGGGHGAVVVRQWRRKGGL